MLKRFALFVPAVMAMGFGAGCIVEHPHHYYHEDEVVVPQPGATVVVPQPGGTVAVPQPDQQVAVPQPSGPAPSPVPPPPGTIVETDVNYGPPPPVQVEVRPVVPYYGAIWVQGHWHREHYRRAWVWIPGHWQ